MENHNPTTPPKPMGTQTPSESGDRIAVGDVRDGSAVAVGRGARAETRIFNIDVRLLPIVGLLVIMVGVLAYFLLRPTTPDEMTGEFNVAVAEFTVIDQNGSPVRSKDGQELANFLFQRLQTDFAELDLQTPRYELWSPAYTGQIKGQTSEERAQAAAALAERTGAHLVIYGVITQAEERSKFTPEFYVNYKGFEEGEEIAGQHELGNALRVALPFDPAQFQDVENPALSARAKALSLTTIGLAYYAIDDFDEALDYFSQAEEVEGWLQSAGKEVIYLLLGNANSRQASKKNSTEYLSTALNYYDQALSINPTYARAQVGRAGVLYLMALGDPTDPSGAVNLDQLDQAAAAFETALDLGDSPESANVEAKVHFGLGQVHFVRAMVVGENWMTQAKTEFQQVVQEYERGNTRIADWAGQAHARLGAIARLQGDTNAAIEHYTRAIELVTPHYQAYYYTRLGEVHADVGQTDLAIEAYAEAVSIAEFYGDEESATKYDVRLNELRSED